MIWHTLVLSRVGLQGDRPLNTLLVVNVQLAQYGCLQQGLVCYVYFLTRPPSHSIMDSWKCRCKH